MKDFLLLANVNAVTYKEFFPLLKEGKARGGYNFNKTMMFETPEGEKSGPNIAWFTTLPTPGKKRLVLTKKYNHNDYPHYDNYDAIEVGKVKDIPGDYDDVMGVPITIFGYDLDNVEVREIWNDNREEADFIVKGTPTYVDEKHKSFQGPVVDGKAKYSRVVIKKNFEVVGLSQFLQDFRGMSKEFVDEYYRQGNTGQICEGHLCFYDKGKAVVPYRRVLIRRK